MRRIHELLLVYVTPLVAIALTSAASLYDLISTTKLVATLVSIIITQVAFAFHDLTGGFDGLEREFENLEDRFEEQSEDVDDALAHLEKGATAEPINESDFYDRFRVDVRNAEEYVFISYFDNNDPRNMADDKTVQYYEDIEDITKSFDDVKVRRLIRAVPQLEGWVDDLIDTHEGDSNFSLACVPDFEPDVDSKPHVAVQLIDRDKTYFVAVGGQEEQGEVPRDLRLEAEPVNRQWVKYYNRIWEGAFVVMSDGMVQENQLQDYKDHIEDLRSTT